MFGAGETGIVNASLSRVRLAVGEELKLIDPDGLSGMRMKSAWRHCTILSRHPYQKTVTI
jgi:hypothetical protein